MKSGSSSAVAFGRVLQTARKRLSKNQAGVAGYFSPPLSVAAVSMAESGDRPPKSEAMVRGYAAALELDDDDLLELWWAMQGMVEVEDRAEERSIRQWWRRLRASREAELDHVHAENKARAVRTPNEDWYAPSLASFALSDAICTLLRRLLGDTWKVGYSAEIGLRDPIEGSVATITIELQASDPDEDGSIESLKLMATFVCPQPVTRPNLPKATVRPSAGTISSDVAWILSSVEAMPARERAAVAGFIHGLREGASLFDGASLPPNAAG